MNRAGRPRSVERHPCPGCARRDRVHAHGLRQSASGTRRAFRCTRCHRTFTPGAAPRGADDAVKAAVRRVRAETGAPYRLLARALTTHLGVAVSHTAVRAWCRDADTAAWGTENAPCQYLSLLWALRQEIAAEAGSRPDLDR